MTNQLIAFRYLVMLLVLSVISCKSVSKISDGKNNRESFTIAVLPDTQYYTSQKNGGTMDMFSSQIDWIINNRKKEKIAYVIHVGDVTDTDSPQEWKRAADQLYRLGKSGIPFGVAVGNHDQTPNGQVADGNPETGYNKYFGRNYFRNKTWFGGAMGNNNNSDNHFDTFAVNGIKYMVLYFAFNATKGYHHNPGYEKRSLQWGDSVLKANADKKSIIVTHGLLKLPKGSKSGTMPGVGNNDSQSTFLEQGEKIYNMAKNHHNVFLMLGGHISGEGMRRDDYNGHVIKSILADYQSRQRAPYSGKQDRNGGGGAMRLMKINPANQTLDVITFTPGLNHKIIQETDGDSRFTIPLYN